MAVYSVAALFLCSFVTCSVSLAFPPDGFQEESPTPQKEAPTSGQPMLINLRRESVPVKRQGKVVSFRTTYSGIIEIGSPVPQEFRVVFDTGSGHVVVPAGTCISETCLVHRRFNTSASQSAVPINADGVPVPAGLLCDQVDISFGTGKITGEFVRDTVCLGFPSTLAEGDGQSAKQQPASQTCLEMNVVTAVQMSTQPFKLFNFDGILGLGLASLALGDDFSFFNLLTKKGKVQSAHFGVFLTEGDVEGEESEIAIGGYNANRFLHPLAWSPVAMKDFGYWQVRILAVRINGIELEVCRDGTCRGVVDTGTSHLGIPAPHNVEVTNLLAVEAGELLDCRLAHTPVMEIELDNINLTLSAANYMRRLPLREGVKVSSVNGVDLLAKNLEIDETAVTPWLDENQTDVVRQCSPRIMAVNIPAPVGPKLFILGEPILHRYYTVFDWEKTQVGFSLANNHRNTAQPGSLQADTRGVLPDDVEHLLMQQSIVRSVRQEDADDETVQFVQLCLTVRAA